MKGKKSTIWMSLLSVLVVIGLALSIYNTYTVTSSGDSEQIYYTMYVGTNDKDTYKAEIPFEEAMDIVDNICKKYLDGVTLGTAIGSWMDETGEVTHENTIQVIAYDTDKETIQKISDEILVALNQNSILIVKNKGEIDFYNGK